ncbi:putative uncharacterized protein ddb_g0277003 [Phtheirospermum japonicum]|uniref:FAM86 N-terminal domain-containing protein n=1 Tax=Phtheirospermum japonicum TaxID=374723 RepID=A0A830BAV2_9LAMI|nr:putative uncharacterized protein ddb_g0277003 [Phtheirospermum japonicum]
MAAEQELDISVLSRLHMVSAFRALEPPDVVISFARLQFYVALGSLAEDLKWQGPYVERLLKKLIIEIESNGGLVLDEIYEYYASCMISVQDDDADKGNSRLLKTISFLSPNESSGSDDLSYRKSMELEVKLRYSVNILEGDTGCSIWPSSLFLSEFILSFPELFANKCCFEVGSGVGLVGICLSHVKASKVILSDGDLLTLANMKVNLDLNHLRTGDQKLGNPLHHDMVHCFCLPWESASEDDIRRFAPDIILGADIIYDPTCLPHLVRVLVALLKHDREFDSSQGNETSNGSVEGRVAYIASVIRNIDTFNCFLALTEQANLVITDLTEKTKVSNFLPYLRSYQRSTIRLFKIHL